MVSYVKVYLGMPLSGEEKTTGKQEDMWVVTVQPSGMTNAK